MPRDITYAEGVGLEPTSPFAQRFSRRQISFTDSHMSSRPALRAVWLARSILRCPCIHEIRNGKGVSPLVGARVPVPLLPLLFHLRSCTFVPESVNQPVQPVLDGPGNDLPYDGHQHHREKHAADYRDDHELH